MFTCNDAISFLILLAPKLHLANCYRPGILINNSGVASRNCGGQQLAQNVNFYRLLLSQRDTIVLCVCLLTDLLIH